MLADFPTLRGLVLPARSDYSRRTGGLAEWSNAAVLKTVDGDEPSVGSNPTASATIYMPSILLNAQKALKMPFPRLGACRLTVSASPKC